MKVHGSMYQAGMHCSSQKKDGKIVVVVGFDAACDHQLPDRIVPLAFSVL